MDQTITIPGWVWLLIIAVVFIALAVWMVRSVGFTKLLIPEGPDIGNRIARTMVFAFVISVPIVCILVTIEAPL